METFYLLILLTQNGAGDINASFVTTQTLEQCQEKADMLESVFKASAIPVIENQCIRNGRQFSEFNHAVSSSMPRNFYLIKFKENNVSIIIMKNWQACRNETLPGINDTRQYCVSSVQIPQ